MASQRRVCTLVLLCALVLLLLAAPARGALQKNKKGVGVKLSNKDLEQIEDQWMDDEVEDEDDTPFKYTKSPDGGRMPPQPSGPKTEMAFVTVNTQTKAEADKLAGRFGDQMAAAGIDVRGYTIEDNRLLFVCDQRGYKDMNKARAFLLRQKEVVDFEWNSKKSFPGDVLTDEEDASGDAAAAADPMARFQAMQDEQAALARREKRKAKREREARQRKKKRAAEKAKAKKAAKAKAKQQEQQQQTQQQTAAPADKEL